MIEPGLSAEIRRLAEVAAASGTRDGERKAASLAGGLPVEFTWTCILVLRPDGAVVAFDSDTDTVDASVDEGWDTLTLVNAARRFPTLASLAPRRPPGAVDCPFCRGRGVVDIQGHELDCGECWGTGWRG